jgi:CPA2 family monovalent cation:H+ antiporter-2
MGALMAESRASKTVEERVKPIRDMFTAIFFVTVGMLLDPRVLVDHWQLVAVVAFALVAGKILSVTFAVFITGNPPSTALRAGFGLAQMGEFSFIIAALGGTLGVIKAPLFEVAVTVSAITAFLAPLLIRGGPGVVTFLSKRVPRILVTYASLYDTWVRRLRSIRASPKGRKEITHEFMRVAAFATVIVAILVIEASLLGLELDLLQEAAPIPKDVAEVIVWTIIGVLVLPFVYLYMTALTRLGDVLSREAMPSRWGSTQQAPLVRRVLRATFMMGGTVALSVLVLAVATPILPALPVLMAVVLAVLLSGAILYRALASFQARVDETLSSVLSQTGPYQEVGQRQEILNELREQYPWGIEVRSIIVPLESSIVGMSIEDLSLRSETGATIIGLRRGDQLLINPPPASSLAPMDRVFLVGEPDQLSKAEGVILEGPPRSPQIPDEPSLSEVRVQPEHSCVGMTLGSLHLHERTGATVIGIKRGKDQKRDPSPELGLEVDDVLLVLGTRSNIDRAEELIFGDRAAGDRGGGGTDEARSEGD